MDTFLSLSAWLMLSGIWDMLISFCSNIAKTEATTACSWSRFYFIEEFDASSTTTCSNVIFPMIHKRHFSRYTDNTCILLSFWERLCKELSVSLSHNLCFSYMCIFRYVNIWACVCLFMHTWSPQFDLGVSSSIALHLNFFLIFHENGGYQYSKALSGHLAKSKKIHMFPLSPAWRLQAHALMPVFLMWVFKIWPQLLITNCQTLYKLSHFSNPRIVNIFYVNLIEILMSSV